MRNKACIFIVGVGCDVQNAHGHGALIEVKLPFASAVVIGACLA